MRGGRLTSDLLLFARKSTRKDEPFDGGLMVQDVAELIQSSHRGKIDVRCSMPAEPCWVKGDVQLVSQVVLNLCLNSIHAMNGKGTLQLAVHPLPPAAETNPGSLDRLRIEVIDHGKGMDAESLQRAFEPFLRPSRRGKERDWGYPWRMARFKTMAAPWNWRAPWTEHAGRDHAPADPATNRSRDSEPRSIVTCRPTMCCWWTTTPWSAP